MTMGKIILLIYVIGAVISIVSRQKKKKKLQQQLAAAQEDHQPQEEEEDERAEVSSHRAEPSHPRFSFKTAMQKGFMPSREPTPADQQEESQVKSKTPRARNILHDVAREFGIELEDEKAKEVKEQQSGQPLYLGQNLDLTSDEEDDDSDESESETRPVPPVYIKPQRIMGPAKSRPQVSPSLAVSLNSSKKQLIADLKNPRSFKKAFILKTILDRPVSLKNQFMR